MWVWSVADTAGMEHEIYSTVSLEQACIVIMIAVSAQLTFFGWMRPDNCLVIRDLERQSDLHPENTIEGGVVLTVGDKLLGCARGASIRRWFCRYVPLDLELVWIR